MHMIRRALLIHRRMGGESLELIAEFKMVGVNMIYYPL